MGPNPLIVPSSTGHRVSRSLRAPLLALALVGLSSCSTIRHEDCPHVNWYQLGLKDGREGAAESRLHGIVACRDAGVMPDERRYLAGRSEGLRTYCTLPNALAEGMAGRTYARVLPGAAGRRVPRGERRRACGLRGAPAHPRRRDVDQQPRVATAQARPVQSGSRPPAQRDPARWTAAGSPCVTICIATNATWTRSASAIGFDSRRGPTGPVRRASSSPGRSSSIRCRLPVSRPQCGSLTRGSHESGSTTGDGPGHAVERNARSGARMGPRAVGEPSADALAATARVLARPACDRPARHPPAGGGRALPQDP